MKNRKKLDSAELTEAEASIRRMVEEVYVDERGKAEPIFDGIVELERYIAAPTRILWILKEPWDDADSSGGGWSVTADLIAKRPVSGLSQSTFQPITYVAYGILKGVKKYDDMPWISDMPDSADMLRSIAFINAKKLPGMSRGAKHRQVMHWYGKGEQIIARQIATYAPDIVLGCAPHFPAVMRLCGIKNEEIRTHGSVTFAVNEDRLFIQTYHPGQTRIRRVHYVDDILQVVSESTG